jgi:hypothetical protein
MQMLNPWSKAGECPVKRRRGAMPVLVAIAGAGLCRMRDQGGWSGGRVRHQFEFADRFVKVALRPVDHRDVVTSGGFAVAVADLAHDGQGLLEVVQCLLAVSQVVVHAADVVEGDCFAVAVADIPLDGQCLLVEVQGLLPVAGPQPPSPALRQGHRTCQAPHHFYLHRAATHHHPPPHGIRELTHAHSLKWRKPQDLLPEFSRNWPGYESGPVLRGSFPALSWCFECGRYWDRTSDLFRVNKVSMPLRPGALTKYAGQSVGKRCSALGLPSLLLQDLLPDFSQVPAGHGGGFFVPASRVVGQLSWSVRTFSGPRRLTASSWL